MNKLVAKVLSCQSVRAPCLGASMEEGQGWGAHHLILPWRCCSTAHTNGLCAAHEFLSMLLSVPRAGKVMDWVMKALLHCLQATCCAVPVSVITQLMVFPTHSPQPMLTVPTQRVSPTLKYQASTRQSKNLCRSTITQTLGHLFPPPFAPVVQFIRPTSFVSTHPVPPLSLLTFPSVGVAFASFCCCHKWGLAWPTVWGILTRRWTSQLDHLQLNTRKAEVIFSQYL